MNSIYIYTLITFSITHDLREALHALRRDWEAQQAMIDLVLLLQYGSLISSQSQLFLRGYNKDTHEPRTPYTRMQHLQCKENNQSET